MVNFLYTFLSFPKKDLTSRHWRLMDTQQCFGFLLVQLRNMEHLIGMVRITHLFRVSLFFKRFRASSINRGFSGIYNESKLFDSLDDILYSVTTYFCDEKSCHETSIDGVNVTSLHIVPYYPSIKFTFGLTNVVKVKDLHTVGINIKPNISCKLYIEDKQR